MGEETQRQKKRRKRGKEKGEETEEDVTLYLKTTSGWGSIFQFREKNKFVIHKKIGWIVTLEF